MKIDWAEVYFSEKIQNRVERLVKEKFHTDETTAEEAITYLLEAFSKDNWKKCHSFKGNSSPETFIQALISTTIVDFHRKKYGRRRPPVWLKKKGSLWVDLWHDHCLNRDPIPLLMNRYKADREEQTIGLILTEIKAKLPWCGVSDAPISIDETGNNIENMGATTDDISNDPDSANKEEIRYLLEMVVSLILGETDTANPAVDYSKLAKIVQGLTITDEEKLILKLRFSEGKSVAATANALHLSRNQVVRQLEAVLARIRTLFP